MSYCINPRCLQRQNPDNVDHCQFCGSSLIINEQYRATKPLRALNERYLTEIFEVDDQGQGKVLKILNSDRSKLIDLFQQEAQVLQRLKHPGIPTVDNFFIFSPNNSSQKLHCLVMEKIAGQDLKQWLEQNQPISESVAIDWLQQLFNILEQVHHEQLLHRDIKPSNIMLRPNGQLVLIDFGTARDITRTYIDKLEERDITRVYSPGYTAPEQLNGQAVWQSDYFALGRTFVYLLTGIHPDDLPKKERTEQIIWRDQAPQISTKLVDLLEQIMAPLPQNRPQNPQLLLNRLMADRLSDVTMLPPNEQKLAEEIQNLPPANPSIYSNGVIDKPRKKNDKSFSDSTNPQILKKSHHFLTILLTSIAVTALVMGIRQIGVLQTWELQAFDRLLRSRPAESPDRRLLVITVTEEDIQSQTQRQGSLSDPALAQLLEKLEKYQPQAIGLDIYRDFPVGANYSNLATRLKQSDRLIAVCKVSDPNANISAVPPPPEIPTQRIGFSDVLADEDNNIVRRQLLHLTPPFTSSCTTKYALNLQLALLYLNAKGIEAKVTPAGDLQFKDVVLKRLVNHTGGYHKLDDSGYQLLLNYRAFKSVEDIAPKLTLGDILKDRVPPEAIADLKNRIILIGVTAPSASDYWATPYSAIAQPYQQLIPGVFLQAQMVSHLISAVLDKRSLIWVWAWWQEALWVSSWALIGGLITWINWRSHLILILIVGFTLIALYSLCLAMLIQAAWIPLIPAAIALLSTGGCVIGYKRSKYYFR